MKLKGKTVVGTAMEVSCETHSTDTYNAASKASRVAEEDDVVQGGLFQDSLVDGSDVFVDDGRIDAAYPSSIASASSALPKMHVVDTATLSGEEWHRTGPRR